MPTGTLDSVDLARYGMDDANTVEVPPTSTETCSTLQTRLLQLSRYVERANGKDYYMRVIQEVGAHMQGGCNSCFMIRWCV